MACSRNIVLMLVCSGSASIAVAQQYSFTLLDSAIPGSTERCAALGISGNGLVIAGSDTTPLLTRRALAWVWRNESGVWTRTALPVPPAPRNTGRALTLSFDGDVIGGMADNLTTNDVTFYGQPEVWRNVLSGSAMLSLSDPQGSLRGGVAGVTPSGDRVLYWGQVGTGENTRREVWTWDEDGTRTLRLSGLLSAGEGYLAGSLVTANVLSASGDFFAATREVFALSWSDGITQQLPNPQPGMAPFQYVASTSRDGNTLVGYGAQGMTPSNPTFAQIWKRESSGSFSVRLLRVFNSNQITARGAALAVSADGSVIGGSSYNLAPPFSYSQGLPAAVNAMLWINEHPILLSDYLARQGLNLQGIRPSVITGISDDGTVLTGYARLQVTPSTTQLVSFVATILPPGVCDDIDFNRDGIRFDPLDIDAFLSVFSEGPCLPAGASCRDIDFNNDGSLFDAEDVDAFLRVFSEGPCVE